MAGAARKMPYGDALLCNRFRELILQIGIARCCIGGIDGRYNHAGAAPFGNLLEFSSERFHRLAPQRIFSRAHIDAEFDVLGDDVDGSRQNAQLADSAHQSAPRLAVAFHEQDHLRRCTEGVTAAAHRHCSGMACKARYGDA